MHVAVRLYGALADFVPPARQGVSFECALGERRSVKDFVESLGVPHCEVFVVLVDGESVGFERVVTGGERIAVYPHFAGLDVAGFTTAGEPLPAEPRFVLDGHLGRLAAYLRALGFDVLHDRDADDAAIAQVASGQDRVVLTRDVGLLKRSVVRHGYWLRHTAPREQLEEVVRRFHLADRAAPFTRCLRCNEFLVAMERESVRGAVPDGIFDRFEAFSRCAGCGRTYWRGTHYDRLTHTLDPYAGP